MKLEHLFEAENVALVEKTYDKTSEWSPDVIEKFVKEYGMYKVRDMIQHAYDADKITKSVADKLLDMVKHSGNANYYLRDKGARLVLK